MSQNGCFALGEWFVTKVIWFIQTLLVIYYEDHPLFWIDNQMSGCKNGLANSHWSPVDRSFSDFYDPLDRHYLRTSYKACQPHLTVWPERVNSVRPPVLALPSFAKHYGRQLLLANNLNPKSRIWGHKSPSEFAHAPKKRRRTKIRKTVKVDLENLYSILYSYRISIHLHWL